MTNKKSLTIVQLYPIDMNIYGDNGNVLAIKKRCEQHGIDAKIIDYNQNDDFDSLKPDIIVGGGGQDSGQNKIHSDLLKIGPKLKQLADNNTPMLMICGLYQLFGNYFKTKDDHKITGIGVFDVYTIGKNQRLIGNILTKSKLFGEIIGYENHSGQTFLNHNAKPLAQVMLGAGNNLEDGYEGVIYKNTIGSYLHGSLLPKNPAITDFLIEKAMINKYGFFERNKQIDDSICIEARKIAKKRPR